MPDVTDVAYPPIINAKPTDMSTVLRAMTTCLDMSNYAGQEHAIQAFDQQLSPDSPALLNCFPINICATVLEASTSVNQQVAKASICPQLT
jgi:hypothetical protein